MCSEIVTKLYDVLSIVVEKTNPAGIVAEVNAPGLFNVTFTFASGALGELGI